MSTGSEGNARRSSRTVTRPNFKALDSGGGEEEEEWSSGDADLEADGRKRKGKRNKKSATSAKSKNRKTAAVGDLEAIAHEAEAAVKELVPQAEAWKEKYASLVRENEAIKARMEELLTKAEKENGIQIEMSSIVSHGMEQQQQPCSNDGAPETIPGPLPPSLGLENVEELTILGGMIDNNKYNLVIDAPMTGLDDSIS